MVLQGAVRRIGDLRRVSSIDDAIAEQTINMKDLEAEEEFTDGEIAG